MKASLKSLILGLFLLLPVSAARAQGPSLSPIPNVSLNAGNSRNVSVTAIDVDDRVITMTASLPPFATLNTPTIGTGVVVTSLTLTPSSAQVGDYTAAVTATAGGVATVKVFQITVNAAGSDQAPIVTVAPWQQVTAGSALSFVVTANDADGNAITSLSASGLPTGATFTPNGANTAGTFNWTPNTADVGEYDVLFTAANALSGGAATHLHVASPPTLTITPIDDVTVEGGASTSVPVEASGVPGAMITLTAALPTFATLNPPGSGTGSVSTTVTVSPPTGSGGIYHASITATSLGTTVSEGFDIIVTGPGGGGNRAPVVTAPATATVAVGATLSFDVTATDPDGDHVDLFGSALPPGSNFIDHADGTGTFSWTPSNGQAGSYTASFSGLDNKGGSGSASTSITVTGGVPENHAPTLTAPSTAEVKENLHLSFAVTASDPDGDHVTLTTGALPSGASFTDHGDNTGTFSWTPSLTQSGAYTVAFLGNDGHGGTGTASTSITVVDSSSGGGGGGGGGPEGVPGRACIIGKFDPQRDSTCFRLKPVNHSFDVRDVVLSSIRLQFQGATAAANHAWIEVECPDHGHGDDGDDDGDHHGDGDHGGGHHGDPGDDDHGHHGEGDQGGGHPGDGDRGGDHHGDGNGNGNGKGGNHSRSQVANTLGGHSDDGDDDVDGDRGPCGVRCKEHGDGQDEGEKHGGACDTLGVRACFSTEAVRRLFAGVTASPGNGPPEWKRVHCALVDAQIIATLTNGTTVVATFGDGHPHGDDDGNDDGDQGKGKDGGGHDGDDSRSAGVHGVTATPNPLHPRTELSFTTDREGRLRVTVYDMQGRLVKKLVDDSRPAGQQRLTWDGANQSNARVSTGVYLIRIQTSQGSITHRIAVVN